MPYPFDQIFAVDPNNTEMVAANSSVLVFEPGDATKTPLKLTTLSGLPLPNPVPTNDRGFTVNPMADIPEVAWESGAGHSGTMKSFTGVLAEAVAARAAAEEAAAAVEVPVDDAVDAGIRRADIPAKVAQAVAAQPTVVAAAAAAVDANPKIAELEAAKWLRPAMSATADFNDYVTTGMIPVPTSNGKGNAPYAFPGVLHVDSTGTTILQRYVTSETRPRTFERRRSGGTWDAWRVGSFLQGSIPASANLNDYQSEGAHEVANGSTLNKPIAGTGVLLVFKIASITVQWFLTVEGTQREFTRRTISGNWTDWQPLSWYQGQLIEGTDWNTLLAPGEWSITFRLHPNQPTPSAGSLTVKRAGSEYTQEFTPNGDTPSVYRRRYIGSSWGEWSIVAPPAPPTPAPAPSDGPTRSPIQPWEPTLAPTNSAQFITELSLDRTVGFNGSNSFGTLRETRDDGKTWTDLYTFPGAYGAVHQLDNGELLCSVQSDPDPRELWLSEGYGRGGTVTWNKVLTASAPRINFAKAWSFGMHKNMIFVNEYGPKANVGVNGFVAEPGQNARYTYMSLDYGKTWKTIFDLNAFVAGLPGNLSLDGIHLHGVTWDPYWDRIWVTFGDNVNGTIYSDDLGDTWQIAHFSAAFSGGHQNVGIVALPKAILFGTDGPPNGVQRIDRAAGKHSGTYTIEQAYTINPGVDRLTHLCQAIRKVERVGGDGPTLFGFGAETAEVPSCIVATYDGFTFTKLWEDSQTQAAGRGLRSIAGPTLKGELIVGSNDGRTPNMWSKWQGPLKAY